MIRKKYKIILIISLIIIFSLMAIVSTVMSQHILHKKHCKITNCDICALINISTNFIKRIIFINTSIFIVMTNINLIQFIKNNMKKEKELTLIEAKVIQNK